MPEIIEIDAEQVKMIGNAKIDRLSHDVSKKETSEVVDVKTWPGDDEEFRGITHLNEFMPRTGSGSETGVCPWDFTADGQKVQDGQIAEFLQGLKQAVRSNAARELLGRTADNLELPADYCEFLKQTHGVIYSNWDRVMFVCEFGGMIPGVDGQAQPLSEMRGFCDTDGFDVAAGWNTGDNGQNCRFFYLLCRDLEEPEEPWQWKIFVGNSDAADYGYFDNLNDFLGWYANAYDRVEWDAVERTIGELHWKCKMAREGA